jgi:predicted MFS family arabinose efflux permease
VAFPCVADAVRCAAMFALLTYLPLYASVRSGGSAVNAGLILTPFIIGSFLGSSGSGRLAHHYTLRSLSQVALGAFALGSIVFAGLVIWGGSKLAVNTTLLIIGASQGAGFLMLMLMIQVGVHRSELGTATGVSTLAKYVGGTLGVGLLGSMVVAPGASAASLEAIAKPAMLGGFRRFFVAIAALALVALFSTLGFPRGLRIKHGDAAALGESAL